MCAAVFVNFCIETRPSGAHHLFKNFLAFNVSLASLYTLAADSTLSLGDISYTSFTNLVVHVWTTAGLVSSTKALYISNHIKMRWLGNVINAIAVGNVPVHKFTTSSQGVVNSRMMCLRQTTFICSERHIDNLLALKVLQIFIFQKRSPCGKGRNFVSHM